METNLLIQCIVGLLLGASIGFERESYENKIDKSITSGHGSLGVRSYSLVGLLGAISTTVVGIHIGIFAIIAVSFTCMLVAYYIFGSISNKDHGFTTELAVLFTFIIGALVGLPEIPIQLTIAITVIIILILSTKQKIKSFVKSVESHELSGFISYAIIAFVILPFVPNIPIIVGQVPMIGTIVSAYGLSIGSLHSLELLNPFSIWRVVAIITGIEILGYFLQKTLGQKKGWLLTSLAGGFVSSTATTQSLAHQSNKVKKSDRLVAAAVFANISSFFQLFLLVATISPELLVTITPFTICLIVSALIIAMYFYKRESQASTENLTSTKVELGQINLFSLIPALKFALIFMSVKIVTKLALILFGDGGFLIGNVLASVTGLDAVIFNVSELAGGSISLSLAVLTLASANAMNLIAKSFYSYTQGSREFAKGFGIATIVMILGSSIGLLSLII